jgi:hypothetical protein
MQRHMLTVFQKFCSIKLAKLDNDLQDIFSTLVGEWRRALRHRFHHALRPVFKGMAFVALVLFAPMQLHAYGTRKLSIATSFPEEFSQIIGKAFEQRHPEIDVSFSYRATTGMVEHLIVNDRARADLVWMSSPIGILELGKMVFWLTILPTACSLIRASG